MEIKKKTQFLEEKDDLLTLLAEMDKSLNDKCSIKSVSVINPDRNIRLNRIELIFLLRKTVSLHNETIELCREMQRLQNKYNLRIDSFILDEDDFSDLLRSFSIYFK